MDTISSIYVIPFHTASVLCPYERGIYSRVDRTSVQLSGAFQQADCLTSFCRKRLSRGDMGAS